MKIFINHYKYFQAAQKQSDSLMYTTNTLYQTFDSKKDMIVKNVELTVINVKDFSIFELTELINTHKEKIHSVAIELNNIYKSHYENVKSEFQEIANSTLTFMKSIKYNFN